MSVTGRVKTWWKHEGTSGSFGGGPSTSKDESATGSASGQFSSVGLDESVDLWLLGSVLGLTGIGLVMVYSASAVMSFSRFGSDLFLAKRQVGYALVGLVAMWMGYRIDHDLYRRQVYRLLLFTFVLLLLVLIPGVGRKVGGARRWFRLGGLSFQPSELAKFVLAAYLSASAAAKAGKIDRFAVGFLPHMLVASLMVVLVLAQPDLGTSVLLMSMTMVVLFAAGTKLVYIVTAVMAATPVAWYAIVGSQWRMRRLLAFFAPEAHRRGAGYQVFESMVTLGSGGWSGLGLGQGRQKLFFLPEGHTDFIFPVIGQELGLIGLVLVIGLLALFLWRGLRAALRASDLFGMYLAFAITTLIGMQALVNMGVVMGLLPTKGLTLPFVSFGGSSLVMTMFSVGVLLRISSRRPAGVRVKMKHGRRRTSSGGNRRVPARQPDAGLAREVTR